MAAVDGGRVRGKKTDMSEANEIVAPTRLWTGAEVLATPSPTPREPGVYGWYFKSIPPGVPTDGCIRRDGLTLLYAGISPKAPPKKNGPFLLEYRTNRILAGKNQDRYTIVALAQTQQNQKTFLNRKSPCISKDVLNFSKKVVIKL